MIGLIQHDLPSQLAVKGLLLRKMTCMAFGEALTRTLGSFVVVLLLSFIGPILVLRWSRAHVCHHDRYACLKSSSSAQFRVPPVSSTLGKDGDGSVSREELLPQPRETMKSSSVIFFS